MCSKTGPSLLSLPSSISNGILVRAASTAKSFFPVLGRPFGEALDAGEIKLIFQEGRLFVQYFDSLFPLSPRSYHAVLNFKLERLKEVLGEDAPPFHEYSGILASLRELSHADRRVADTAADRRWRFEASRDRLKSLVTSSKEVATFVDENISEINGKEGDAASFGFLQRLLAEQNYKLAFWQNLNESINYVASLPSLIWLESVSKIPWYSNQLTVTSCDLYQESCRWIAGRSHRRPARSSRVCEQASRAVGGRREQSGDLVLCSRREDSFAR